MWRNLTIIVMAFSMVLPLAGCKDQSAPAPSPSSGAPVPVAKMGSPELNILLREPGLKNWETHNSVSNLTKVTWKSDDNFWIEFPPKDNPCRKPSTSPSYVYQAQSVGDHYEAYCTISIVPTGKGKWEYLHGDGTYTVPAQGKKSILNATSCKGCILEEDPY